MDKGQMQRIFAELSNKEKAIVTSEAWKNTEIPNPLKRYGIQRIKTADSAKEMDYWFKDEAQRREDEYQCVTWPSASALGASWNAEEAKLAGKMTGRACKNQKIDILFRPGMNIKRSPLCGRNFEYFSEDPVLSGELAAAYIRGVQEEGVSACPKHFVCNNQEFERMTTNAVVSERALREIYMRGFQIALRKGKPWSLMTSYNRVNGAYVNENRHLMDVLRKEFGFDGYITSDGAAIQTGHSAVSHACGMDYELGASHYAEVQNALDSGELTQAEINENIQHLLEVYEKIRGAGCSGEEDQEEEHALARRMAADCLVLLSNNGVLPLTPEKRIAVIGAMAKQPLFMGAGSGFSNAYHLENAFEEISKILGEQPLYAPGYRMDLRQEGAEVSDRLAVEAAETAGQAEIVLFFSGLPFGCEGEGLDRSSLYLPEDQRKVLQEVMSIGKPVVLINNSGAPVDLSPYASAAAILQVYPAGESTGGATADVLYGMAEPGGRLAETYPVSLEDTPAFLNYVTYPQVKENVLYGEDIFVGYRWYDARRSEPLFCFGHGLSYTDFSYGKMELSESEISPQDRVKVTVDIYNKGKRAGSQVLQLYVHPENASAIRPPKELKAFAKVYLEPGEKAKISMELDREAFEYYSEEQKKWVAESGRYQLLLGVSSREIIDRAEVRMISGEPGILYHRYTPVQRIFADNRVKEAAEKLDGDKKRILIPDEKKDVILGSPFAYAVPIYHAMEDDSIMVQGQRLTEREFSEIMDRLNKA